MTALLIFAGIAAAFGWALVAGGSVPDPELPSYRQPQLTDEQLRRFADLNVTRGAINDTTAERMRRRTWPQ